jgi:antitoxin (DNA-binding transcriptional repressor) of toxin-antitoxin stability system
MTITQLSMRELGKLTAEQLKEIDHPIPVTSNGVPVAWLAPLTAGERRRAQLVAEGRLRPRRREDLPAWRALPRTEEGPSLSEILAEMREQDRT